jgi:acyl carrier protein
MSEAEILDRLRELVRSELGWRGPVEPESTLAGDLGLDSVKLLTLVVELENAFRVVIEPDEGAAPPVRVAEVVALIARRLVETEDAA